MIASNLIPSNNNAIAFPYPKGLILPEFIFFNGAYPKDRIIYLLSSGEYFKIGKSSDVEIRIKQLQTGNPMLIELKGFWVFHQRHVGELEVSIQNRLSKFQTIGEWFSCPIHKILEAANMSAIEKFGYYY